MFFYQSRNLGFRLFCNGKTLCRVHGWGELTAFVVSFSSFSRSFCLSRFALPLLFFVFLSLSLSFLSALLFSALFLFPTLLSLFYFSFFFPFLFLFPFFLSFFFPSFPSFPLCSLRIKFLCSCKKYGPAAVLMNTQYGTRKYHRPEISQKGVLGQTSSGNRSYT